MHSGSVGGTIDRNGLEADWLKGEDVMELTVLISALQREVEKRRAVDEAAAKLAQALGMEAHEHGLQAIEKSIRDIGADRIARRLRPINSTGERDSASDSANGSGETSPDQSA
jgi:hypothetical protein